MDHLGAISLFIKVVETGSFAEAGRQSNLATSSVSRRVADLEDWVGTALFHRTTRRLTLTEAGRQFHDQTSHLLLDLEHARVTAAQLQDTPSGHIHLSMPASLEQHIVLAAAQFQSLWPMVSFNLTSTERQVDLVAEGFDLAIRAGEMPDSTLRSRKIARCQRRLCASPAYLSGAPGLDTPADIANHACLLLGRSHGSRVWRFKKDAESFSVQATGTFSANSGNMLVEAARQGRGLILSGDWILGPYVACGDLVEVLTDYQVVPHVSDLHAVHPYQKFVPPKVRMFIEFLIERFAEGYDWTIPPQQRHNSTLD